MNQTEGDDWLVKELMKMMVEQALEGRENEFLNDIKRQIRETAVAEMSRVSTEINSLKLKIPLDRTEEVKASLHEMTQSIQNLSANTPQSHKAKTPNVSLDQKTILQIAEAVTASSRTLSRKANQNISGDSHEQQSTNASDGEDFLDSLISMSRKPVFWMMLVASFMAGFAVLGLYYGSINRSESEAVRLQKEQPPTMAGTGTSRHSQPPPQVQPPPAAATPAQQESSAEVMNGVLRRLLQTPVSAKVCEKIAADARTIACLFPDLKASDVTLRSLTSYLQVDPQSSDKLRGAIALSQAIANDLRGGSTPVDGKWGRQSADAVSEVPCMKSTGFVEPKTSAAAAEALHAFMDACRLQLSRR